MKVLHNCRCIAGVKRLASKTYRGTTCSVTTTNLPAAPAAGSVESMYWRTPGVGLRFGVWGLGFGVWGLRFGVCGLRCSAQACTWVPARLHLLNHVPRGIKLVRCSQSHTSHTQTLSSHHKHTSHTDAIVTPKSRVTHKHYCHAHTHYRHTTVTRHTQTPTHSAQPAVSAAASNTNTLTTSSLPCDV
jgi:hypothetical protein